MKHLLPPIVVGLLLLVACQTPPPAAPPPPPPPKVEAAPPKEAAVPPSAGNIAADACLDLKLKSAGLNQFGDAEGTVYAGGTPLFEEGTGRSLSRREYIARKHPELTATCPTGDGGAP